jgi:hypothetical protein
MKKPGIAVLLNAFPLVMGLGYVYLGLWGRFAITFGLQVILGFVAARGAPQLALGLTLLWIFSMLDAHRQGKTLVASRHDPAVPKAEETGTSS